MFCYIFSKVINNKNKKFCKRLEGIVSFLFPIIIGAYISIYPHDSSLCKVWIIVITMSALGVVINLGINEVEAEIGRINDNEARATQFNNFNSVFRISKQAIYNIVEKRDFGTIYTTLATVSHSLICAYAKVDSARLNVYVYVYDSKTHLHKRVGKCASYSKIQPGDIHKDWNMMHEGKQYLYEKTIQSNVVCKGISDKSVLIDELNLDSKGQDPSYSGKFSQYGAAIFSYAGGGVKLCIEVITYEDSKLGDTDEDIRDLLSETIIPLSVCLDKINWENERKICDALQENLHTC